MATGARWRSERSPLICALPQRTVNRYNPAMLYELIRPLLFSLDPENAHDLTVQGLHFFGKLLPPGQAEPATPVEVMGLRFPNRIGLAAGLDKNGEAIDGLSRLGFGFLEIGTITPSAQIKLLHILQEKAFERVGGEKLIPCDVRILAATNEDPAVLCEQGKFRWDLFYRLNVFPIEVPPLRRRVEDILPLAEQFIANFRRDAGRNITSVAPRAARALQEYSWPGNVRELENIVERACILEETDQIQAESLPLELLTLRPETQADSPTRSDALMPLHAARAAAIEEFERRYLWALLQSCNGSIKKSADTAGITTRQLHKLMTRHRLDKKSFRPRQKRNP